MTIQTSCLQFEGSHGAPWRVSVVMLGGLPIAVIDRARSADLMIDVAQRRRGTGQCPLIFTSANGHVLSICGSRPEVRELYLAADLIHADGMPLVFSSRLFHKTPLPERVATTDLFHDVARLTQRTSPRIFLLGGTYSAAHQATKCARALYPGINIVGSSGGYLRRRGDEDRIIDAINNAGPDILWLGLGAPAELSFAMRHRDKLRNVGLIKTSGGLFDFLSGKNARAPSWMQTAGLEWCYRLYLEPRRLGGRYLLTNPHALLLLLTQTGQVDRPVQSSNER